MGCVTFKLKIPVEEISEAALRRIIEEFVLREGTDYGREYTLEQKCEHVRRALADGGAEIHFDPTSETVDIRVTED